MPEEMAIGDIGAKNLFVCEMHSCSPFSFLESVASARES